MQRFTVSALVLVSSALLFSSQPASAQFLFVGKQPICTQEYRPVCAVRDGMRRTYSNACTARADGARIIANGPCRRVRPPRG